MMQSGGIETPNSSCANEDDVNGPTEAVSSRHASSTDRLDQASSVPSAWKKGGELTWTGLPQEAVKHQPFRQSAPSPRIRLSE